MSEEVVDAQSEARLKTTFVPVLRTGRLYSGGKIDATPVPSIIAASALDALNFVDVDTGLCVKRILLGEEDQISSFVVRPVQGDDGAIHVVIAFKSLQLKHYSTADLTHPIRAWKGHSMPVVRMAYDATGTLVACGSSDGRIIVYDVAKNYITHSFNQHTATVTSLKFLPGSQLLVSCSQDASVVLWDLLASRARHTLAGHLGAVSDACLIGNDTLVSVGRDRVIIGWNLKTGAAAFTTPIYDSLEACCALAPDSVCVGGTDGTLKVFRPSTRTVVWQSSELKFQITNLLYDAPSNRVVCATADQNLVFYAVDGAKKELRRAKVLVGDLDQVADVSVFGAKCEYVAVATNSKDIKLWNSSTNDWSLLCGHTDMVLSVDASVPGVLASGGKDASVRVWCAPAKGGSNSGDALFVEACVLVGHTDAVNAVRVCDSGEWVASVSKDRTVKVWPLQREAAGQPITASTATPFTAVAHAGEVNCVDVSPRSKGGGHFVATGGADKTVALWFVEAMSARKQNVKPVCKLSGHKRGIWDVRFSGASKLIASASGDGTVRLWRWGSNGSSACTRVLQGHSGAVLRVTWITFGTQVVSAGSDGLLKIWSAQDSECLATLDGATPVRGAGDTGAAAEKPAPAPKPVRLHAPKKGKTGEDNNDNDGDDDETDDRATAKLWALEAKLDGQLLISGDSSGQLCVWRDHTLETIQQTLASTQREMALKQDMENHIKSGSYAAALAIALAIDHRAKCKHIVDLIRGSGDDGGLRALVGQQLDDAALALLVRLCAEWNKNATHCAAAQAVMHAVLKTRPADTKLCDLVAPAADSWLAFSERHEKRLNSLIVNTYVLDHCLESIGGDVSLNTVAKPRSSAVEQKAVDEPLAPSAADEAERQERRRKTKGRK